MNQIDLNLINLNDVRNIIEQLSAVKSIKSSYAESSKLHDLAELCQEYLYEYNRLMG